ncbi:hypothetical protein QR98_0046210 [Sarcoptes scabiei]|uniref:Uncharacterized protein n=1 Tax=Sarcoptes scabiei TaxID=52283 RepID=A0A132A5B5_SARSC|nr:hypothetical protein QR98_0046210 [Sarcoptes scabiei]
MEDSNRNNLDQDFDPHSNLARRQSETLEEINKEKIENESIQNEKITNDAKVDERDANRTVDDQIYPNHLDPFDEDETNITERVRNLNDPLENFYPDDLNPFVDEEEVSDEESLSNRSTTLEENYPSDFDPFGDDDASDDDIGEVNPIETSTKRLLDSQAFLNLLQERNKSNDFNQIENLSESLHNCSLDSVESKPTNHQISPRRKKRPAPLPPRKNSSSSKNTIKQKKRPAPPRPALKRSLKISAKDLDDELETIAKKLPSIESEQLELESWLIEFQRIHNESIEKTDEKEKQELNEAKTMESDNRFKENLEKFLGLAKQKCQLVRKQKELMKREIKLEEIQLEIEYQLRIIMSKQENQKTESDHQQEQSLLEQMMAIIDERNEIIENMIQDENREIEDYHRITEKVIGSASSLKNIVVCESKNIRKNPKRIPKKLKIKLPKFTTFNHRSKVKSHSQSAS